MKTKVSFITRTIAMAIALVSTTAVAFADGEITDVYSTGSTSTPAGDYVVRTTNDVFYFQGEVYDVYKVYYDDPSMNLKIAVNQDGKCKSFIAYSTDYTLFYKCTKDGFGVRRVLFSNPEAHERFNALEYSQQSVLTKQRRVNMREAIDMIAAFVPVLQTA